MLMNQLSYLKAQTDERQTKIANLKTSLSRLNDQHDTLKQKYEETILETEQLKYNLVEKSQSLKNKCYEKDEKERNLKNQFDNLNKIVEEKIAKKELTISQLENQIKKMNSEKQLSEDNLKNKLKQAEIAIEKQKETFTNLQK